MDRHERDKRLIFATRWSQPLSMFVQLFKLYYRHKQAGEMRKSIAIRGSTKREGVNSKEERFRCLRFMVIFTRDPDVLAFANSSLNPYIYFFHNKDMHEAAKKVVIWK
jgi:hypothetical protein